MIIRIHDTLYNLAEVQYIRKHTAPGGTLFVIFEFNRKTVEIVCNSIEGQEKIFTTIFKSHGYHN